ncbi:MAG: hypothetical protein OET79_16140, partial [Nitrospirota bacterium]|nr:hypothetical protein [Nitrospirota bacterium]
MIASHRIPQALNLSAGCSESELEQQWSEVQALLRAEFGETAYKTWLAPLAFSGFEGERVLLAVPTR